MIPSLLHIFGTFSLFPFHGTTKLPLTAVVTVVRIAYIFLVQVQTTEVLPFQIVFNTATSCYTNKFHEAMAIELEKLE